MGRPATAAELAELDGPTPVKKSRPATPEELKELNGGGPSFADEAKAGVDTFLGDAKAAADTYSLGTLPRGLAAADAVGQTMNGQGDIVGNYNHALRDRQADSRKTAAEHPSASITGAFLPGPGLVGKGATLVQRLAAAIATGAAAGNLQAPADDADARLAGTLTGGIMGGATHGANEAMGPLAARFSGGLARDAEMAAPRAAGLRAGITNQAQSHGMENEADIRDFGRKLLDSKLVTFGGTTEGVAKRAEDMASKNIATKNDLLQRSENTGIPYDYLKAKRSMTSAMEGGKPGGLTEEQDAASKKARDFIERMGSPATGAGSQSNGMTVNQRVPMAATGQAARTPGSVIGADRNKSAAYDAINWNTEAPEAARLHRKAASGLRQDIEDHVSDTLGAGKGGELHEANARTGLALDAKSLANDAIGRDAGKVPWWVNVGGIVGGGITGQQVAGNFGLAGGVAVGALGSVAKSRGPSALAVGADTASKLTQKLSQMSTNPVTSGLEGDAIRRYLDPPQPSADDETDELRRRFGGK